MKKNASISIQIPELCQERRSNMDKTENGWFCHVCAQEVIDFTQKSDAEVCKAFENPEKQPCGVYRPDQLNRQLDPKRHCKSYVNTWKAMSLLMAGALAGEGCFMGKRVEPKDESHVMVAPAPQLDHTPYDPALPGGGAPAGE